MQDSPRQPKYLQLAETIRAQVEAGIRRPGDQLPSFAQMQAEYSLSQSTLEKMYTVLEQQKLIVREPGRGIFIAPPREVQSGVLGLLANHAPENHPYYSQLLAGTREAARNAGMELLLLNDFRTVRWEKVDGVLLCLAFAEQAMRQLPLGIPRVSVLYPLNDIPAVASDDYQGMREAVEYLLELGHRRIGFITVAKSGTPDAQTARRFQAYHDVLKEHGITVEPNWVMPLRDPYDTSKTFMELGRNKMRRLISEGWLNLKCTAVLAQNDDTAIGIVEALQEASIRVPEEMSVMGFDGTELAEYFRPKLTTVQVPLHEIGKTGTNMLLKQMALHQSIESQEAVLPVTKDEIVTMLLPARLLVGDSVAPPREWQ